jgi:hypothetical protein
LVGLDGTQGLVVAIRGVPEEDDAEHRHAVFAGGELGVGAEVVGGLPQIGFELFDGGERIGWLDGSG